MSRRRLCCSFLGVATRTMRSSAPFPRGCTRTAPGACRNVGWSPGPRCCSAGETPPSSRAGGCSQPRSCSAPGGSRLSPFPGWENGEVFFPDSISPCWRWRRAGWEQPFGRSLWQRGQASPAAPRWLLVPSTGTFPAAHPGSGPGSSSLCRLPGLSPAQELPASPQHGQCSGMDTARAVCILHAAAAPCRSHLHDSRGRTGSVPRAVLEPNLELWPGWG